MHEQLSLGVYCGHRPGADPAFIAAAASLGRALANGNMRLVYGAGKQGLMGACARAVRDNHGAVLGVIPDFLAKMEGILEGIEHRRVTTMHERKMIMYEEADAICALPGGIGTLEEIVEILSWAQLGLHRKPVILLNINGYWDPMMTLFDHLIDTGFAVSELAANITILDDPDDVIPAARSSLAKITAHLQPE